MGREVEGRPGVRSLMHNDSFVHSQHHAFVRSMRHARGHLCNPNLVTEVNKRRHVLNLEKLKSESRDPRQLRAALLQMLSANHGGNSAEMTWELYGPPETMSPEPEDIYPGLPVTGDEAPIWVVGKDGDALTYPATATDKELFDIGDVPHMRCRLEVDMTAHEVIEYRPNTCTVNFKWYDPILNPNPDGYKHATGGWIEKMSGKTLWVVFNVEDGVPDFEEAEEGILYNFTFWDKLRGILYDELQEVNFDDTVSTRTSFQDFTIDIEDHGQYIGQELSVVWEYGSRHDMKVHKASNYEALRLFGGTGDDIPVVGTPIRVLREVSCKDIDTVLQRMHSRRPRRSNIGQTTNGLEVTVGIVAQDEYKLFLSYTDEDFETWVGSVDEEDWSSTRIHGHQFDIEWAEGARRYMRVKSIDTAENVIELRGGEGQWPTEGMPAEFVRSDPTDITRRPSAALAQSLVYIDYPFEPSRAYADEAPLTIWGTPVPTEDENYPPIVTIHSGGSGIEEDWGYTLAPEVDEILASVDEGGDIPDSNIGDGQLPEPPEEYEYPVTFKPGWNGGPLEDPPLPPFGGFTWLRQECNAIKARAMATPELGEPIRVFNSVGYDWGTTWYNASGYYANARCFRTMFVQCNLGGWAAIEKVGRGGTFQSKIYGWGQYSASTTPMYVIEPLDGFTPDPTSGYHLVPEIDIDPPPPDYYEHDQLDNYPWIGPNGCHWPLRQWLAKEPQYDHPFNIFGGSVGFGGEYVVFLEHNFDGAP